MSPSFRSAAALLLLLLTGSRFAASQTSDTVAIVVADECAAEVQASPGDPPRPLADRRALLGDQAIRCTRPPPSTARIRLLRAVGSDIEVELDARYGWYVAMSPPPRAARVLAERRPLVARVRADLATDDVRVAMDAARSNGVSVSVQTDRAEAHPAVERLRAAVTSIPGFKESPPGAAGDLVVHLQLSTAGGPDTVWLSDRSLAADIIGPLPLARTDTEHVGRVQEWMLLLARNRWLSSLGIGTGAPDRSVIGIDHLPLSSAGPASIADSWYATCGEQPGGPAPRSLEISVSPGDLVGFRAENRSAVNLHYYVVHIAASGRLSLLSPSAPTTTASALSPGSSRCLTMAAVGAAGSVERFLVLTSTEPLPSLWEMQGFSLPAWLVGPIPADTAAQRGSLGLLHLIIRPSAQR